MSDHVREYRATVTEDPLASARAGATVRFAPVQMQEVLGTAKIPEQATPVDGWSLFDGAVCFIGIRQGDAVIAMGSAVIIAPGLAVTAAHCLTDSLQDALAANEVQYLVAAPTSVGCNLWNIRKVNVVDTPDDVMPGHIDQAPSDVMFLSLELASELPAPWILRTVPLTTRLPRVGERLYIAGFRIPKKTPFDDARLEGMLYLASGVVNHVYEQRRDALIPYPAIEIGCEALGSMSGGPVLDSRGLMVGLVTRSMDGGPTYAAWLVPDLHREVEPVWPKGLHAASGTRALDLHPHLMRIDGREHVTIDQDGQMAIALW